MAAVYTVHDSEKWNPDICALPPRLPDNKAHDLCVRGFPGYSRDAVDKMKLSDRFLALDRFKDYVRVYLPYYIDFSRRLLSCLESAYYNRTFAIGKDNFKTNVNVDEYTRKVIGENQVLAVAPPISASVQCMALIGVAGTGKSTCSEMITSIYPHVLRHEFETGYKYLQIPILQLSAVDISDEKSLLIRMAGQIDLYIGQGNVDKTIMIKQKELAKMQDYFCDLAKQFHVGMVIIDEVQMIGHRKKLFENILSLSNTCHVSICLIGTEESMPYLNSKTWFVRRFGELGQINADSKDKELYLISANLGMQETASMTSVLNQIWRYQWTYKYTQTDEPDAESVKLLVDACVGNIDLLTTLFIKSQRIAIKKGKGYCLSPEIVREAVMPLSKATELLKSERKNLKPYIEMERKTLRGSLRHDIAAEVDKEAQATQKELEDRFILRTKTIEDITYRITAMADYGPTKIEKVFDRLTDSGQDLYNMDPKQRAMLVFAELQKGDLEKEKSRQKNEKKVTGQAPKKRSYPVPTDQLTEALSGGIDDITNIQANIS